MRLKSLAAVAAGSLITAPVATAAPFATPLSLVQSQRAGAGTESSNELVGTTAWILAAIGLGLIVWGIIELTDYERAFPASP